MLAPRSSRASAWWLWCCPGGIPTEWNSTHLQCDSKGTKKLWKLKLFFSISMHQMNFKVWRNFFFKTRLFNAWMKGVVCLSLANITNSRDRRGAFGNAPSDGYLGFESAVLPQFLWNVIVRLLRVACESVVSGPCCFATSFMASSNPGHAASFLGSVICWAVIAFHARFHTFLCYSSSSVLSFHTWRTHLLLILTHHTAPRICSLSEMAALGPEGGVLGVHFPVKAPWWLFKMNGTGLFSHFLIEI